MRVMVFTPTYGEALRPETVASVVGLRWDGEVVWEVGRRNPFPPPDLRNVFVQYEWARAQALAGGYDALLTVEHDMVIPSHALERMWAADGDVVYGVYVFRHGTHVINAFAMTGGSNIGSSLSLYPKALARAKQLGEVEVSGAGFGCTLIRRSVLEAIPFRMDGDKSPDIPFAQDCLAAGVRQVARFDVRCGHVDGGEVLEMAESTGIVDAVVVDVLADVVAGTSLGSVRLRAGSVRELPRLDATELERAGYVRVQVTIAEGDDEGAADAGTGTDEVVVKKSGKK